MSAPLITPTEDALCESLCEAMRWLVSSGLNRGTSGNVSVRTAEGFLITPSGVKPHRLTATSIVRMDSAGQVLERGLRPSTEWRFHKDIYASRADAAAIVHVHSAYSTALACRRQELPAFHYMIAVSGGDSIRCSDYATFGTQALSDAALAALVDRRACLLANHGMIALGGNLEAALDLAVEIEELARQYMLASLHGEPILLNAIEMQAVVEQFRNYGASYGQSE